MQKFFSGQGQKSPKIPQLFPKQPKNRPQGASGSALPYHSPCRQADKIPQPQVSPADAEGEKEPDPHRPQQKSAIRQRRMPEPEWTQKAVIQSQRRPQHHAAQQPVERRFRRHPNNRRRQPPLCLGSS